MPLGKPALAALAILSSRTPGTTCLHPLVYMPSDMPNTMLTVGLAFFQQQMPMAVNSPS